MSKRFSNIISQVILSLLTAVAISCHQASKQTTPISIQNHPPITPNTPFNDSGFILKKDSKLLVEAICKDSVHPFWKELQETDTVGKYYTVETGNKISCLKDPSFEFYGYSHLLIETTQQGNRDSVLVCERYRHGSYPCCWKGFDGFKRIGNYIYFRSCGTGSGFCSGSIYLFKKLLPEAEQNPIVETIFSQYGEEYQKLSSEMQLQGDGITMHYLLQTNLHQPGTTQFKHRKQKFTVNYTLQQNQWVADDSTNLKDLAY